MFKIRFLIMVSALSVVFGCGAGDSTSKLDTSNVPPADPGAVDFSEGDLPQGDGNI